MPTPARSATAEIGASAPWTEKTSRAASRTARSFRRACACRPQDDSGFRSRNAMECLPDLFGILCSDRVLSRTRLFRQEGAGVRAVVMRAFGPPQVLEVAEVPDPLPGPGEVTIDVELAGVTFVETQVLAGRPPSTRMLPRLPALLGDGV